MAKAPNGKGKAAPKEGKAGPAVAPGFGRLEIVYRPIADLIPYARNARTHSDAQVAQLAASIREFGWTNPILTDGANGIIAGHGRTLAARKLGLDEAPTIDLSHLSEAQKRAYVLADNQLALNAGWDTELLKVELQDLEAAGFDVDLVGFHGDELAKLLDQPVPADPAAQAEPEKDFGGQYGVIVTCADETEQAAVYERLTAEGLNCKVVVV